MIILGIDPGKGGGIAWVMESRINMDGTGRMQAFKMPPTEWDIQDELETISCLRDDCFAYIEKVHAMPGQGVTSMFSFGQNYGFLRGCLISHGIPFEEVTPGKWQREFGLVFPKRMGLSPTEKKNRHKAKAQQLFPELKITHATADAVLLADYGRRIRMQEAMA